MVRRIYDARHNGQPNTGSAFVTGPPRFHLSAAALQPTLRHGLFHFSGGSIWVNGSDIVTSVGDPGGNITSLAVDIDNKLIWFRVNGGNWNASGTANPATGAGGISISAISPTGGVWLCCCLNDVADAATLNVGNSAFSYTVPSGFTSWDPPAPTAAITTTLKAPTQLLDAVIATLEAAVTTDLKSIMQDFTATETNIPPIGNITTDLKSITQSMSAEIVGGGGGPNQRIGSRRIFIMT